MAASAHGGALRPGASVIWSVVILGTSLPGGVRPHLWPQAHVLAQAPAAVSGRSTALAGSGRLPPVRDTNPPPAQPTGSSAGSPTARLLNPANRDTTVSPCQDFDQYVNGGWLKRDPWGRDRRGSQPGATGASASGRAGPLLDDLAYAHIVAVPEHLLQAAWRTAASTTDTATRLLGQFYGSCMTDTTGTATGTVGDTTRARYCLRASKHYLSAALEEQYARQVVTPAVQAKAALVLTQLKQALRQQLQAAPWLSAATQQRALTELAAMQFQLGGIVRSDGDTVGHWPDYTGLELSPTDFKGNLAAVAHAPPAARRHLFFPWTRQYAPDANFGARFVTAVLLAPPFFDTTDVATMYGTLGFILGHELGHYLDPENAPTTWTASEQAAYAQRRDGVLAPYTRAGIDQQGWGQVPAEHIADFIGLRLAYALFQQAMQGRPAPRIDGLTPDQRFFVAVASGMAYIYLPSDLAAASPQVTASRHGAPRLRTNLAVASFPVFARAFGCQAGDPMVWSAAQAPELFR